MRQLVRVVSVVVLAAALCGSLALVRAVMAGDRLLQPLRAKYGELSDFEWYSNDEARAVFHGPGPMGENSWPIYFAGWLIPLLIGASIAGAVGLSFRASRQVCLGGTTAVVVVVGILGWSWLRYGESIKAIASVVE